MVLILIGVLNLIILAGIVGVFRRMRHGELDEAAARAGSSASVGFLNRLYGRATRAAVTQAVRSMYPLGLLFGLGFDTATEIALLATAGAAAAARPTPLRDPLPARPLRRRDDPSVRHRCSYRRGGLMNFAYGWAWL